ncbi:MAG: hypothetical protein ABSA68_15400 [Xanthobacteraceae bacterium]
MVKLRSSERARCQRPARGQASFAKTETQPPTPQPAGPTKEETAALERAIRERHAEEGNQLRLRQEAEYKQTAPVLEEESREKLGHFDALQQAARERFFRETDRAKTGFDGFIDAIKEKLNPQQAAEDARERKGAAGAFLRRQEKEREDRIARLRAAESTDLADLTERHQQQQREHNFRYDENRARHLRELDAAANRLAEIEERRRQEERAERERSKGRPPAARTRTLSGSRFLQPKPSRFLTEKVAAPLRQVSRFLSGMAVHTLELAQRRIAISIAARSSAFWRKPPPPHCPATLPDADASRVNRKPRFPLKVAPNFPV